jgi:hypothetical protein
MRYDLEIENDHYQILMGDRVRGPLVDTVDLWSRNGDQKVAALPGTPELVAIGTARFGGKARVEVEIALSEPGPEVDWSAMGDFLLDVRSGEILFWAPESLDLHRSPMVSTEPGRYLGRAFSRRTDTVADEMAVEGADEYRIVLWRVA